MTRINFQWFGFITPSCLLLTLCFMGLAVQAEEVANNDVGVVSGATLGGGNDIIAPKVDASVKPAIEPSVHRLRSSKIRASQLVVKEPTEVTQFEVVKSDMTPLVLSDNARICPAANCDCDAISLADWRERCLAAELKVKRDCASNNGVPRQYCTLHGPNAAPVAINTARPAVPVTTAKTLRLHKRQAIMLMWSIKDDLDNIQQREQEYSFGDAVQVHKLLNRNIDRLYLTQRLAAEGERLRGGDGDAEDIWQEYRQELADLVVAFDAYAQVLWSNMHSAVDPEKQKAYRVLAMRIGRSASTLSEHYALAYTGEGNAVGAAKAWQRSAIMASDLMTKEQGAANRSKRVAYYRYQSAARWNRASFYWMKAKKGDQVARTANEAERVLAEN